jgi:hypothetical protein
MSYTSNVPLTSSEFDLSNVTFKNPVKETAEVNGQPINYYKSYVNYGSDSGILLQTPKLYLHEVTDTYLEVLLNRKDKCKLFYKVVASLEQFTIDKAVESSYEWFNRDLSHEQVFNMFKSSLTNPTTMDDPFVLRVPLSPNMIVEDPGVPTSVVCLLRIEGVMFGKTTCKLDMKVVKTKFVHIEPKLVPVSTNYEHPDPAMEDSFFDSEPKDVSEKNSEVLDVPEIREVAEAPVEVAEAPVEVAEAPVEVAEAPVEVAETPVEVSSDRFEVNEFVLSKYHSKGDWVPSKILAVLQDNSYDIVYEDGTKMNVVSNFVKEMETFDFSDESDVVEVSKEVPVVSKEVRESKTVVVKDLIPEENDDDDLGNDLGENVSDDEDEPGKKKPLPIHPGDQKSDPKDLIKRQIQDALEKNDVDLAMKLGSLLKQF